MQEPQDWRALLGSLLTNVEERQRVATALGVNPVTLMRWTSNAAMQPRISLLRRLPGVLPLEQRHVMSKLLAEAFPEFVALSAEEQHESVETVPAEFYERVLHSFVTTPLRQRFWSISNLILQQALGQLDSRYLGMAITIAQCTPPRSGRVVRSLLEVAGRGTPPWKGNLEGQVLFLGAESLAGYALMGQRLVVIQDRNADAQLFPAHWTAWETSAVACPILLTDAIAGCLLVSSTQPQYFSFGRQKLIQQYAEMLVLAFEPQDFYSRERLQLEVMLFYQRQAPLLLNVRQQLAEIMLEASSQSRPLTLLEAQRILWQELEEELIQRTVSGEEPEPSSTGTGEGALS